MIKGRCPGNRCADEQARAGAALHEHDPLVLERLKFSKVLVSAVARYLGSALAWIWKVFRKPAEVEPVAAPLVRALPLRRHGPRGAPQHDIFGTRRPDASDVLHVGLVHAISTS